MWIFADEKIAAWIAASEKGGFSHRIPTKFLLYLLNVFEKIPKKLHLYLFFSKIILTFAFHFTKNRSWRNKIRHWRDGRVVECGGLENR